MSNELVPNRRIHVIPVGGIEPIHAASENCECQPYCGEDGTTVHHAFDAREIRERHNHQVPDEKWVLVKELLHGYDDIKRVRYALEDSLTRSQQDAEEQFRLKETYIERWEISEQKVERLERENAALQSAAVEVCALARVWATVWHDKLSAESIQRFTELEQQILKEKQP